MNPPSDTAPLTVAPLQPIGVPPLEAARLLGTSLARIYRLLRSGQIRAVKMGGATLVLVDSIREYASGLPPAIFGRNSDKTAPTAA
jgi:excisionase family DNA binding protein